MSNLLPRRAFLARSSLALGAGWLSRPAVRSAEPPAPVLALGTRRELFVDDHLVERLGGGATLRLHQPVPREVALTHDAPWEGSGSGYHTVIQESGRYRLYYRGLHLDVTKGKLGTGRHEPFYCYAESDDGIRWTKPDLGLVEFQGSKRNNIILRGVGTHNFAPFLDTNPAAAPDARFKALGGLKSEGGLFAFQSADGIRWSRMRPEPVITNGAFDSQNVAFFDANAGCYRAYWRSFTAGVTTKENWKPAGFRAVRTGVSPDFLDWTGDTDLTYVDSPDEHLYTNQVHPYVRAPQVLIGFPTRYVERGWSASMRALPDAADRELRAAAHLRYGTGLTEGLLMASHDGRHFKRWNEAFLPPGVERPGTWQYGHQYLANHAVVTRSALPGAPDELSLYATEGYWHGNGARLRRHTLRLDGFVSVNAPWKGGELITRPLTFGGTRLTLNFATSAAGGLRVELQTPEGRALPGFALADCPPQFGDSVERTVHWQGGTNVGALAGKPVRLRFELRDADLYSLRFQ